MEYLNRADIYLGDASSQIYEFLIQPRPCLFFNSHGTEWAGNPNYAHWNAGRVVGSVDQLEDGLRTALDEHHDRYRDIQLEMLRNTFDLTTTPSSERAADAILKVARHAGAAGDIS